MKKLLKTYGIIWEYQKFLKPGWSRTAEEHSAIKDLVKTLVANELLKIASVREPTQAELGFAKFIGVELAPAVLKKVDFVS